MDAKPKGLGSVASKDGLAYPASIRFFCTAYVVPAGKQVYQTVKFDTAVNISQASKRGLMKMGVNVWRSSSHDVINLWGQAVMSEMVTYPDMYTL